MAKATGIVSSGANAMARAASVATAALGSLGVGLSAVAMINFAKQINDGVDALNDMADATGSTVEKLSALDNIERRFGHSTGTATSALLKLNQSLSTTDKAGSDAEKVLTALGLSVSDLKGMDPADALMATAQAMSMFADDSNKARAAQELFGKSLKDVAPLLKDLVEAGELNATVTTKQAQEAEKFNRELFKMETALTDAGRAIANPMITGMNGLIEQFRLGAKEGDGFIVTLLKQTEIARLLRMNKPGNGYAETRRELDLLNKSLLSGGLSVSERDMAEQRQAELLARLGSYLNSTAGAGRGVSGYGDLPKGSLVLPPEQDKKAIAAAKKEREDQAKLLAELSGLSGSFAEDWARLNTIYAKGAITVDQLTEAQANLLAQQPAMKKMADERKQELEIGVLRNKQVQERAELEAKLIAELLDSRNRQFDADAKVIKSAEEMVKQAEFELSIMGLSNVERDKAIALRQLEATGIDKSTLKYAELAEAMSKAVSDRAAMQKQIDDFQNVWNSIDRTAQQTFTNIFEGGQDAFTKLRDTLKATLLDLLYQMTVRKWVFSLAANVTGASSAAVAGAVTNAIGFGSVGNLGAIGAMSGAFGGGLSAGFGGLTGSIGGLFGAAGNGTTLGGALSAGSTALGAGNIMGGLGTFAGALGPIVLGIGALSKMLDSKGGPKAIGGASDAATIQATVQATLAQFGIRGAGLRVGGFSAADPAGDSLTQLQTALFQGDRALYSRQDRVGNYENVGRSSEELAAAWAEEQSRIMLAALQATLEPKYLQYLREVDANASSVDDINAALTRLNTARTLEERLLELSSTEAENLARARARELDAMDETLRPLLRQIQAQEDLKKRIDETNAALLSNVNEAYEAVRNARSNEVSQLDSTVTRLRDYGRSLREFRDGLLLGNLSTLTPGQRLEEARRQLDAVASKARTGDQNAQGQVQGLVSAFLEASATYNASGAGFTSDFAYTQQLLTDLSTSALAGADVAQLQLDALGVLNQSVLTIPAALTGLATAITTAIGAGLNPGAASIGALAGGVTGQRVSTAAGSVYASTGGAASLGNIVYTKNGKTFTLQELQNELISAIVGGATSQDFAAASAVTGITRADALAALAGTSYAARLPAFRNGGSHMGGWAMVGEGGPELAYMPPSRIYSNSDTRQMLDIKPLVERIKSLEGTVEQLGRALVAATYDATDRAAGKTVDGVAGATSRASFAAQTVPVLA